MTDSPRPLRLLRSVETFELTCWCCHRNLEIAANAQRYCCGLCGAALLIEWRGGAQEKRYAT